ncbi:ligand-gated ion channel [Ferruginibacter profundus]
MKKIRIFIAVLTLCFSLLCVQSFAGDEPADTVYTGIYVTSIHDIDFKQKEYTVNFWLWLKYKNKKFDFLQNLEVPQAKSVARSFSTIDSSGNKIYILMKLQCVMKDSWKIGNFPFDRQNLRLSIENSQFDSHALIFMPDTLGKHYDARFTLSGWKIDSFNISAGTKVYETGFGDETLDKPHTEYSNYKVKIGLEREATGLFWKMFLGMYVAFLIAYICFYIHADGIDSRFGLSVGSLFAVIGNKYIIDSALPESTSFTLVDTLHGLTLFFIFSVITCTAYTLKLVKQDKIKQARRFDLVAAQVLLLLYVVFNIYFISRANAT